MWNIIKKEGKEYKCCHYTVCLLKERYHAILMSRLKAKGNKLRVVTRYVESGIKGLGSGMKDEILDHSPGIKDNKPRESAVFLRHQESGCTIFVGSERQICHAFGIKD